VVAIAFALPYTPLGAAFHFVPPPEAFYPLLAGLIIAYLLLAEFAKKWFYKRYAYLLEQGFRQKR
jgi:Mg2+-importing ATPase